MNLFYTEKNIGKSIPISEVIRYSANNSSVSPTNNNNQIPKTNTPSSKVDSKTQEKEITPKTVEPKLKYKDIKPIIEAKKYDEALPLLIKYYNSNIKEGVWTSKTILMEMDNMFSASKNIATVQLMKGSLKTT